MRLLSSTCSLQLGRPSLRSVAKNRRRSRTRANQRRSPSTDQDTPPTRPTKRINQEDSQKKPKASFKTCGEAIKAGLTLFQRGEYTEALDAFSDSLELPGQGRFRLEGRAKEFSGPSKSEEDAALYNMMCCHSKLGEVDSAIICLEALLESGFDNYEALRNDADLQKLRSAGSRFEETIKKFDSMPAKVSKMLQDRNKTSAKKPWLI